MSFQVGQRFRWESEDGTKSEIIELLEVKEDIESVKFEVVECESNPENVGWRDNMSFRMLNKYYDPVSEFIKQKSKLRI